MSWAANARASGPMSRSARLVLIAMAEPADVDGCGSFLSVATIAERVELGERQVVRCLRELEEAGYIARSLDQGPATYIPANRRPTVYDLSMLPHQTSGVTRVTPLRGDTGDTPSESRGDISSTPGVSPVTPKPRTKHNHPPVVPPDVDPQVAFARQVDDLDAQGNHRPCGFPHPAGLSCPTPAPPPPDLRAAIRKPQICTGCGQWHHEPDSRLCDTCRSSGVHAPTLTQQGARP